MSRRKVGDRLVVGAGLAGVAGLGWAYLLHLSSQGASESLTTLAVAAVEPWSKVHLLSLFLMWAVMMTAMMLPSAARMILGYAAVAGRRSSRRRVTVLGGAFLAGYLALWTAFSGLAALAQWGLYGLALLTPAGRVAGRWSAGLVLLAAGIYQWTSLKHACLRQCRSPFGFLVQSWRDGPDGAFRMGMDHGAYCVGCCAGLMILLFAAGVMNLLAVAAVAAFVLVEKMFPAGEAVARTTGAALVAAGVTLLLLQ